jgi:hypothetical protein
MPYSIPGSDWRALRPSCYVDDVYQQFRQSVGQYALPTSQMKAAPVSETTAETKPLRVSCQQTITQLVEVPLQFDPAKEDVLTAEATFQPSTKLKLYKADVERIG